MPIRFSDLRTRLLRATPGVRVGAALQSIRGQPDPTEWLLLVELDGGGYALLGVDDLARRTAALADRMNQPLGALDLTASPLVDAEDDLAAAQALLGQTGYVVVLRDEQPLGLLASQPAPTMTDDIQRLFQEVPPSPPVSAEASPKTPIVLSDEPGAPTKLEPIQKRVDRYVNTDFAAEHEPGMPLPKTVALQPNQAYFFRLSVGELEASSIEAAPAQLPEFLLDQEIEVVVVLFSESFEIEESTGVLKVPATGAASVSQRASDPAGADAELLEARLLFHVRTPPKIGRAELRVNMYCRGMLIQSRLVRAVVGRGRPLNDSGVMRSSLLDFNLSPAMAPRHLSKIEPHKLSLMVNSNPDGTHGFRLLGGAGQELFQNSVTLSPTELADLIEQARRSLRLVAWGTSNDWDGQRPYRYEPSVAQDTMLANMRQDLIGLAIQGRRLYGTINKALGGGRAGADRLRELMRQPGMVQMASKVSANDVVPLAMFYDSPLDSQSTENLTICPTFETSLASGGDLLNEPCFVGNCPSRDQNTVVCPSAFWGFRHDIGMPWPAPYGPEMATEIRYESAPVMNIAFYHFPSLGGHLDRLGGLGYQAQRESLRDPAIAMFKTSDPHLVYFYCHGVLKDNTIPLLRIGSEASSGYFETINFEDSRIRWADTRPLVMINGCHTTALSPNHALSFVKSFVEDIEAAGVIGTEITIFEPLAQRFSEIFFQLFFQGEPLGRAIRRARLQLLAERNPLGLVYDPFAYAGLRLVAAS